MESVTEHFKRWGHLLNVKVLKDWMQRPYSFVQFEVCGTLFSILRTMELLGPFSLDRLCNVNLVH